MLSGSDVHNPRQLFHAIKHARHPFLQFVDVGAPQSKLILRIALPSAGSQILCGKHEYANARDLVELVA